MDLMDYRRKIISNSPHLKSASGGIVSFSDGADLPLKSLNVDIEPSQSGTGDPSPSNIRPISGWSAVKVTRTGKNLSPINAYNVSPRNYWGTNWTELIAVLNTLPVGVYTISNKFTVVTLPNNGQVAHGRIYITAMVNGTQRAVTSYSVTNDTSPTVGKVYQESGTFTITEEIRGNINHAYLYCDSTDHSASSADKGTYTLTDVQIELGSSATPYEAYTGQSVTVQLGQTVYGGTLNPLTGVLTVDRQFFELDGNSDVTKGSSGSASASEAFPYWATIYIPCNNATTNYSAWRFSHGKCQSAAYSGIFRTYKTNNTTIQATVGTDALLSTTADAKTWLQAQKDNGTPLQIVAELTEPITIQLTPRQVRSLYGSNTIFADTGNVALEYWAHP